MFTQNKSKRQNNSSKPQGSFEIIFLIFSIFVVISLYWRWVLPGAITWGDWWYYTKSALSDFVPVLWNNTGSLGEYQMASGPILSLVTLQGLLSRILHCDFSIVERITVFYPLVLYLIFSPWYLAHTLGFRRLGIATTIIVFSLNSYVFHIVGVTTFALAIALGPFVMATFIQTVQRPRAREGLLLALAVGLQIIYEVRISYVTFCFCALYLLYFMVTSLPRNWQILLRLGRTLFLATLVVLLIHSYWLIPLLSSYLGSGMQVSLLPTGYGDPHWVRALSYWNLLHVLGLQVPWWGAPGKINPPNPQFLLLPILAFSVFLFSIHKRKQILLFFGLTALIFSFLAKGSKPPFGEVYIWLFLHFPGFSMFREPGKWWFPVVISYAILFAFLVERVGNQKFLERIGSWLKEKIHLPSPLIKIGMGIVVIGAFFLIFPVQPISVHRYIHHRYENPEIAFQSGKTYIPRPVPQEYLSLEDFLHKQPNFFRTLWFPARYRFGYFSSQHPGLSGVDLSGRLSSFCSGNPRERAYKFTYISHPSILLPLRLFSIKYIIVPDAPQDDYGDYYWYGLSPKYYYQAIEENSNFSPIPFEGDIRLYEVADFFPHFYATTTSVRECQSKRGPPLIEN